MESNTQKQVAEIRNIIVAYFHGSPLPGLKYNHNMQFSYSKKKRNNIIDSVIAAGYNVMIQAVGAEAIDGVEARNIIIWIDKYRFQQR